MRRESCLRQMIIDVAYEGVCDRCKLMSCPNYGTCVDDGTLAKCVCQDTCIEVSPIFVFFSNLDKSKQFCFLLSRFSCLCVVVTE